MEREGAAVMCDGRLFHRGVAATGNALSPTVDRRVSRMSRDVDEAERSHYLASFIRLLTHMHAITPEIQQTVENIQSYCIIGVTHAQETHTTKLHRIERSSGTRHFQTQPNNQIAQFCPRASVQISCTGFLSMCHSQMP